MKDWTKKDWELTAISIKKELDEIAGMFVPGFKEKHISCYHPENTYGVATLEKVWEDKKECTKEKEEEGTKLFPGGYASPYTDKDRDKLIHELSAKTDNIKDDIVHINDINLTRTKNIHSILDDIKVRLVYIEDRLAMAANESWRRYMTNEYENSSVFYSDLEKSGRFTKWSFHKPETMEQCTKEHVKEYIEKEKEKERAIKQKMDEEKRHIVDFLETETHFTHPFTKKIYINLSDNEHSAIRCIIKEGGMDYLNKLWDECEGNKDKITQKLKELLNITNKEKIFI